MNKEKSYALEVGTKDEERLDLLEEICGPYTHRFLLRIGLRPGMRILDVGCGIGNTSLWLAKQDASLKIVGVDSSEEQIAIAKSRAKISHLENVKFEISSAENLQAYKNLFDLVFCRFLLIHVPNPTSVLQEMYQCLKPDGFLACDEQYLHAMECFPASQAFTRAVDLIYAVAHSKKVDFDIGIKLYALFRQLHCKNITLEFVQYPLYTARHKYAFIMLLESLKTQLIQEKLITKKEFSTLIENLSSLVENDDVIMMASRNTQIVGQKV